MDRPETLDLEQEPSPQQRGRGGQVLLALAGGLPTLGTLGGFLGSYWWPLDLLAAMRLQYVVVLGAVVVLALLTRSWRAALLFLAPLAINLAVMAPLYQHPDPKARDSAPPLPVQEDSFGSLRPTAPADDQGVARKPVIAPLRILTFNARPNPRTVDAVLDYLRESPVDLIVFQDLQPEVLATLEYQIAPFRIQIAEPRDGLFGLGVAERLYLQSGARIVESRTLDLTTGRNTLKAIECRIQWMQQTVMLLAVRMVPPLSDEEADLHDRQITAITQWARLQEHPVIITGSMSATPWSATFRYLLSNTGLVNSQCGFGVQPTWPSSGGPLGQIPIDHLLHSESLVTIRRHLGPSLGTDHQSLEVALWWRQPPELAPEASDSATTEPAPATQPAP
jgi:endonuclease/exonuclease/phosphatase (EEP) superfamily protein YafD